MLVARQLVWIRATVDRRRSSAPTAGATQSVPGAAVARPEMAPRAHQLTGLLVLAASFACIEAVAQPAWARRTQVALPFCGLSDVGCAGDTPSCDCVSFMFKCDLATSGCTPLTLGTGLLVVGTVLLLLCCCCGGAKTEGYEGARTFDP